MTIFTVLKVKEEEVKKKYAVIQVMLLFAFFVRERATSILLYFTVLSWLCSLVQVMDITIML